MKSYETFADLSLSSFSKTNSDDTEKSLDSDDVSRNIDLSRTDRYDAHCNNNGKSTGRNADQSKRLFKAKKKKANEIGGAVKSNNSGPCNSDIVLKPKKLKSRICRKRDMAKLKSYIGKKLNVNKREIDISNVPCAAHIDGSVSALPKRRKLRNTKKNLKGLFHRKPKDSISLSRVTMYEIHLDSRTGTENVDSIHLSNETVALRKRNPEPKSINSTVRQTSVHQCPLEAYLREKYRRPTEEEKRTILELKSDISVLFNELQDLMAKA